MLTALSTRPLLRSAKLNSTFARHHLHQHTTAHDHTYQLPDKRAIGYSLFGSTSSSPGATIIYLHGLPGSRVEGIDLHLAALQHNVRIIAPDRPGYGLSTFFPGRSISSYVHDVLNLADHLELDTFHIAGSSGGGPYALACARYLPLDRLKSISVIAGLAPFHYPSASTSAYGPRMNRSMMRYLPNMAARLSYAKVGNLARTDDLTPIIESWKLAFGRYKGPDEDIITSDGYAERLVNLLREAFRQGWRGFAHDGKLLNRDWDFKLEDIQDARRVTFYCGGRDEDTPPHMGKQMQNMIQGSKLKTFENASHLSLIHHHATDMVEAVVKTPFDDPRAPSAK